MSPTTLSRAQISISGPGVTAQVVSLESDTYEVGRGDSNALCFPDVQGLSRRHFVIEREAMQWRLRDAGSTNGTFVNGSRLSGSRLLIPGDRITAGDLNIIFSITALPPPPVKPRQHTVVFVDEPTHRVNRTVESTLDDALTSNEELQRSPHMQALIHAGRELCGQSSLDELFKVILDLSVSAVGASRGVLITIEGGELRDRASLGAGFRISSHVRDLVLKEGRSLLIRDALRDQAFAARMSIIEARVRAMLAVPLQTDKKIIGLIYLDSPGQTREFTKADLNVLTVLANIAAVRIEQARLAEIEQGEKVRAKELEHAAMIQRSILPPEGTPYPYRKDFHLHAAMVPAREVGGDFFDYFLLDDGNIGFVIGDVSGKGVPAALFMAVSRTLLRATAQHLKSLGECFTYMNATLCEGNAAGMFVTLFYGVLNLRTGELQFANGGHNPPYIISSEGKIRKLAERGGPVLGVLDGWKYQTLISQMQPGDAIMLYTDGVTEAISSSNEFYGDDRLERYLESSYPSSPESIVADLHKSVKDFAKGAPQSDDITVLVLQYTPDAS